MSLAAGRLRHRIEIQEQETAINTFGERTTYWAHVCNTWASVEDLSVRELVAAQQVQSEVSTRIMIRHRPGIRASMRILFRGQVFDIKGITRDKDSGIEYLTLACSQGINEG